MSSALMKASPLKADIRLAQAVSEFEAELSSEQKSKYRTLKQSLSSTPGPADVMRFTAEFDRLVSTNFNNKCVGPRFANFLQGVQKFAALGDVVIGGSQNLIACGVWSLVRFMLLSIISMPAYIDKLSSLFMEIGRSVPRQEALVLVYPQSAKLRQHLTEYYIVVVKLCAYLFRFGQKSGIRQIASSLNDSQLKTFQGELDRWSTLIKSETDLNEAQESSGVRALSKKFFDTTTYQRKLAVNAKVLEYCSAYDHQTTWKQIRKAGNTSLYTQSPEYQTWRSRNASETLIFTGKLGSGKSVALANVVDDLHLFAADDKSPIAYFFCRHDIAQSLQSSTILGSLVRQLLSTLSDLSKASKYCEGAHFAADTDTLLKLLSASFPSDRTAYFILDGLDECDQDEQKTLMQALKSIQQRHQVLICISYRVDSGYSAQFISGMLSAKPVVSSAENEREIELYIDSELTKCLEDGLLVLGDDELILEIYDALLKGSQGMFLWVALQIRSLCQMKTDHDIRAALANLPKDISETYYRILNRSGSLDQPLQTKIMQFVLAARRPLTTDELREALSVVPGDTNWDPSRMINDVYQALACCGPLLVVDEEDLTVHAVHDSVKQCILGGSERTRGLKMTKRSAKRALADTVITYLNYGVFDTQLSTVRIKPMVTPAKIIGSTMNPSRTTRLALKLLEKRKQPAFDFEKTVASVHRSLPPQYESTFQFVKYARAYWIEGMLFASEILEELGWKLIQSPLPVSRRLGKEFWVDLEEHYKYAGVVRRHNLLELLRSGKIDRNAPVEKGMTPLIWAVDRGFSNTAWLLVRSDISKDEEALTWAAKNGRNDCMGTLLDAWTNWGSLTVSEELTTRLSKLAMEHGHDDTARQIELWAGPMSRFAVASSRRRDDDDDDGDDDND